MVSTARIARAGGMAALCLLTLGACEGTREAIGIGAKQSPDEFAVVTRAPLSLPPDYGLRPPKPGAQRPQEAEVKDSARSLLVESAGGAPMTNASATVTRGELALLTKAGATNTDPNIRQVINREAPFDFVFIDAEKEAQRLRENAALGDAPTKGRTVTIRRKPKGWLEGIF